MTATAPTETVPPNDCDPSAIPHAVYRPHLDGLRAVAVYLVVLFHAGVPSFSAGYVGVDVFFVLSGYLVTQLLLRDLDGLGAIRLGRFYSRRFRRLLPAAFLTLLISAAVYSAIVSPADALDSKNGFEAAFLYVTNWFLISRATAYFGGDITKNPVLHFWSLAVEEQFYLLWPLMLGGLFLATRRLRARRPSTVRALVVVGALTSLAWALFLQDRDPNRAYYGTDARAYQLLAGASLALAPGLIERLARVGRSAQYLAGVSLAGLVILGSSLIPLGVIERGLCVTVTAALLLASVESAAGGLVKRVLSSSPFVFLGKISYATYLWHWPVIIVMVKLLAAGPVATAAIATLVATSIASLSFQLCERPIRESRLLDGHRHLVIGTGLAVSVVSALLFIPAIVTPGATSASAQGNQTAGFSPIPPGLDFAHAGFVSLPKPPECLGKDPEECTIVHGTGPHVLLMGDSHAQMMLPTFTEVAHRENLTFSAAISGGCPWQRNLYTGIGTNTCVPLKEDFYTRVIPALNPDVIVLMNFGYDDLSVTPFPVFGTNRIRVNRGNVTFDTLLAQTTIQSLAELRAEGRKLVIIEPIPRAASEPTQCLRTSKVLEACRYVANTKPSVVEQLYRMLAKQDDHVLSVDIDRLVCPYLPICDPVIGGHIVKIDAHHLTAEYARYLADDVDAYLKANGVLAR